MKKVSIIIPAYEEQHILGATLAHTIDVCGQETEIIVIDQSCGDDTQEIVKSFPSVRYACSRGKSRSTNMNQGAKMATGDVLLFLHADCFLPTDVIEQLVSLDWKQTPYGAFAKRMYPRSAAVRVTDWFGDRTLKYMGYMLGDNAMFMTRLFFEQVGGFWDKPLFEDIDMARKAKKQVHKNNQKRSLIPSHLRVSARKFETHGPWKMFRLMLVFQILFFLGFSVEKMHRWYMAFGKEIGNDR